MEWLSCCSIAPCDPTRAYRNDVEAAGLGESSMSLCTTYNRADFGINMKLICSAEWSAESCTAVRFRWQHMCI